MTIKECVMPKTNLDPKKLLGFRLLSEDELASASVISAKIGGKIGVKIGAKRGVKEDQKTCVD